MIRRSRGPLVLGIVALLVVGVPRALASWELCALIPNGLGSAVCSGLQAIGANDPAGAIVAAVMDFIGTLAAGLAQLAQDTILNALPDAPDLGIPSLGGLVVGYAWLNTFLPIDTGITVAGLLLAAMLAKFAFRVALTVWHAIPKPFMGT
jgi:hypothetical protein